MSELSLEARVEKALLHPKRVYEKDAASQRFSLRQKCTRSRLAYGDYGIVPERKIVSCDSEVISEDPEDLIVINSIYREITGFEGYDDQTLDKAVAHELQHAEAARLAKVRRRVFGMEFVVNIRYDRRNKRYSSFDSSQDRTLGSFFDYESGPMTNMARASIYAAPEEPSSYDHSTLMAIGYPDINDLATSIRVWNLANPGSELFEPLSAVASEPI